KRMSAIEKLLFRSNAPTQEYVLLLNDGVARNFDCPHPKSGYLSGVLHWLQSTLTNHWQINAHEQQNGNPGMRSVLCTGQRMNIREATRTSLSQVIAPQPIAEFLARDISVYSPRQFQMNLAFSKAYLLESLGSKIGLGGPNFFIEDQFLSALVKICESEDIFIRGDKLVYRTSTIKSDGRETFLIQGEVAGNVVIRLAIELDEKEIQVNHRGIVTKLFRVARFQPMDENDNFWFDFCNYEFEPPPRPVAATATPNPTLNPALKRSPLPPR
ncbi:MAG: hypothetical protein OEV15_07950, partial [Gallionella sp.]|nr:hypothetical protein [Gallionella sp.]